MDSSRIPTCAISSKSYPRRALPIESTRCFRGMSNPFCEPTAFLLSHPQFAMKIAIKRLFDPLRGILLSITASVLVLAMAAAGLLFGWPGHIVYWRSEESIESYLKTQTPLGSSQVRVTQWLRARGVGSEIHEAVVKPNSHYPPTKIGGTRF